MPKKQPWKVAVAMSGGVDSSVAAALLVEQGYSVMGAYMKNFSTESWRGTLQTECPWEKDVADAEAVCRKLGIPFRTFNFEREYRRAVLNNFFDEYRRGRTPNPDVRCNREIKFGSFLAAVRHLGYAHMATGHYARIVNGQLQKGVDAAKDQSYFLYVLTSRQLAHTLFPIGGYTKDRIRQLARRWKLPTADKKDSQGICFVGPVKLREFLAQEIPHRRGLVVDTDGHKLGYHDGVWYYTIGQRHGIGIAGPKPYYVVDRNAATNTLVVAAGRQHPALYRQDIRLSRLHWIGIRPKLPLTCRAKIRYQQNDQACVVRQTRLGTIAHFRRPQFAVAPGQAVVLYRGSLVLGGGIASSFA
ncbi:MAG: tRNA 2-thiouridine(34) synthase MnmA [Patescibacteria group bacterium]|nr:tRNA 2-thiouridine(34) synthase MnmA [Patescibacteria group bacterium]